LLLLLLLTSLLRPSMLALTITNLYPNPMKYD
jgi:hypothetical protein